MRAATINRLLLGMVLCAMLPVLVLLASSGIESRERRVAAVLDEAMSITQNVAFKNQRIMESTKALLISLGHIDEIRTLDRRGSRIVFRSIMGTSNLYTNLVLLSPDGRLLASARSVPESIAFAMRDGSGGPAPADLSYIHAALESGELFIGESYSGEISGRRHLRFAYPLHDTSGLVTGVLSGGVDIDRYRCPAVEAGLPEGGTIILLDRRGTPFLTYPPAEEVSLEAPLGRQLARMHDHGVADDPEPAFIHHQADTGDDRMLFFTHLYLEKGQDPYMTVVLSLPISVITADGNRALATRLSLLLVAGLAAFAIVVLVGKKRISGPMRSLLGTARALRRGNLTARADESGYSGEMQRLARSFNLMAEAMETREREALEAKIQSDKNNAAKSDFLAAMSHAIRTPMNSVIGIAYLLMKTPLDARRRSQVSRIYSSANTLLGIINDILDFSNIESGRFSMEHAPFQPRRCLDTVLDLCGQRAEERGVALRVRVEGNVPDTVLGDSLRLGQVLTNLVGNSVKFTEQGEVVVHCRCGEQRSPDGCSCAKEVRLEFCVEDTGIGMTEEQVAQVFTDFSQADETISRRYGGTGLGLAISMRLVKLMGGEMTVQSRYGKGTAVSFTACFEVVEGAVAPEMLLSAGVYEDEGARLAGFRVLLVEDNPINQEIAAGLLESAGAEVTVAGNGREALDRLVSEGVRAYDVVLMDIQMPVMDGYEATRSIRALGGDFTHLPVVAMTAHAMQEEREYCLECGMNAHLAKPLEVELFFATIRDAVGKRPPNAG